MTARAEARMSHRPSPRAAPLLVGLAVTLAVTLTVAGVFAAAYVANRSLLPIAVVVATPIGLGIAAGFASRRSLRNRGRLLRLLVALGAMGFGLLLLGWLSAGIMGVELVSRPSTQPYCAGPVQLALGTVSVWLAVFAWGARRPQPAARPAPPPPKRREGGSDRPSPDRRPARRAPAAATPRPAPRQRRGGAKKGTTRAKAKVKPRRAALRLPKPKARASRRSTRHAIRLVGEVEHRCPYCLEVVKRNDPRGVKTCEICHTAHHADCWAVTGTCQVPHHHG